MFSIHGVTRQNFRGSLEHLIQVPGEQDTDPRCARAAVAYAKSLRTPIRR